MGAHSWLWPWVSLVFRATCGLAGSSCNSMDTLFSQSMYKEGDMIIGGLFPIHLQPPEPDLNFTRPAASLHCINFDMRAYRWLQTMIFAVDEINRNPQLLPNITLGYALADTCLAERTTLAAALGLVTGKDPVITSSKCGSSPQVPVIVGDARSSASAVIARTLGVFNIPMVSYFATCACLGNHQKFPTFFRTVPSDAFQARAMAHMLRLFGWTWVGVIMGDDDYGKFGIQLLLEELENSEVCVAFFEVIPKANLEKSIPRIIAKIRKSTAKVIVTFAIATDMHALLMEVVRQNITDKQWIATESWITANIIPTPQNLRGTLGFALRRGNIQGLKPFLIRLRPKSFPFDPFVKEFWEVMFRCTWNNDSTSHLSDKPQCTGSESLDDVDNIYTDVSQLRATYSVYKAVYAIAHAIHNKLSCQPRNGLFEKGRCPNIIKLQPQQILHYLSTVNFTTPVGEAAHFDRNGEPPASYDIINWHVGAQGSVMFVKVGQFDDEDGSDSKFDFNAKRVVWGGGQNESMYKEGDMIIGGLFPIHLQPPEPDLNFTRPAASLHCINFDMRAYRWLQTMIFAVDEINRNPQLLPNITLGYALADTCLAERTTLAAALGLVTGKDPVITSSKCGSSPQVPVIVGDARSSASAVIARTLGVFNIPMVSYFATCACLGNHQKFPTFFRTVPSDAFQARAMAHMLRLFGWTWVGVIMGDDDYGKFGIQLLLEELENSEVCVAFFEVIPKANLEKSIPRIIAKIRKSTAKVIVTFAIATDMHALLMEVVRQNITDKQWIATESWITANIIPTPQNLRGTLGFALRRGNIQGLKPFLIRLRPKSFPFDPFVKEFWEVMFRCTWNNDSTSHLSDKPQCTGSESLDDVDNIYTDVSQLRATYSVYKAVYAIAHAIHNKLSCQPRNGLFEKGRCPNIIKLQPQQILHYLSTVNFTTPVGEAAHFDRNGEPPASYDIINWHVGAQGSVMFVKVGQFDDEDGSDSKFDFNAKRVVWGGGQNEVPVSVCSMPCPPGTRKALQRGKPICCFDCLPCPEGEISNSTGSAECKKCPDRFWSNAAQTTCIPKKMEFLSFLETMGIILAMLSISGVVLTSIIIATFFLHRDTPLVKANNAELSFLLLLSLCLCFLCALVFIGRPAPWSCMLRHTLFGISFVLCLSCVLSRTVVVLVAFRASVPGNNIMRYFGPVQQRVAISLCTFIQVLICMLWLVLSPPIPAEIQGRSPWIILECNMGSVTGFACVLGYIGLLAAICFLLAFLARKLPDNFNEAKFITFSMLIFCAVWITFIPAYVSSPGKYTVAVEIFAILASSYGLLLCIFAPKCYIILLRPEKNIKKMRMVK